MAWNDPAPTRAARPALSHLQSPGYGPSNSLPFLTILGRGVIAIFLGVAIYVAMHSALVAWQVAHRGGLSAITEIAIAALVAVVIGFLALRYLLGRPRSAGLPLSVRDGGGGWSWSRRRGWDDGSGNNLGYGYPTLGEQVAADVAGGIIDAVIDAVAD